MAALANKTISIKSSNKIFPELLIQTNFGDLGLGQTTGFDLKAINGDNQVVKVLETGYDAVDNVFINPIVDGKAKDVNHTLSSGYGIDLWDKVFGGHVKNYAAIEWIQNLQNNSATTATNYRMGVKYLVDAYDSMTKISQKAKLNKRDQEAISILQAHPEITIDPIEAAKIGIGVPKTFEDFLKIHETFGTRTVTMPRSTTLTGSETDLANIDVNNTGDEALVLEGIDIFRPSAANGGKVIVNVYRDFDPNAVLTFDATCLETPPTGTISKVDLHIHAFQNIQVTVKDTSAGGTFTAFKAAAHLSQRRLGAGFKAKLEEFLGPQGLPSVIDINSKEREIIDSKYLKEFSRVGLIGIG
jgi:hypothetical protein